MTTPVVRSVRRAHFTLNSWNDSPMRVPPDQPDTDRDTTATASSSARAPSCLVTRVISVEKTNASRRRCRRPTLAQLQALRDKGFTHIRLLLDDSRLSGDGGAAYLDDAARGPEQRIVSALKAALPSATATELQAEKGLVKITR